MKETKRQPSCTRNSLAVVGSELVFPTLMSSKCGNIEGMDWRQLLDVLQDNNQDQNIHNDALFWLSKQDFDKNNIPERIQQELDIAGTVAIRTKGAKDTLHQEILRHTAADRQEFISMLVTSCSTKHASPIKTMSYNLVIDSDELQTTIPSDMCGPINAAYQAQAKFNELEAQPQTQREKNVTLEQRERGTVTQFLQAKWSEERRKKYHLWLQTMMPIPYYHSFVTASMTTTVQNMFNLAELVAQNMVQIVPYDSDMAVQHWAEYRTKAFVESGKLLENQFVVPVTSLNKLQEKNPTVERIHAKFILDIEQKYGLNPSAFKDTVE